MKNIREWIICCSLVVLNHTNLSGSEPGVIKRGFLPDGSQLELTKHTETFEIFAQPGDVLPIVPGAQVSWATGRYERVVLHLTHISSAGRSVLWTNTSTPFRSADVNIFPQEFQSLRLPEVLDWTAIGEYVLVLCRFPDSGLVQIDAVTIAGTKGPVTMAVPKLLIDGGMARSGIRQGRFISFAEDSLYLCTVPYTGKAVNQVTLWKVNLEKGAIEFLGHYDRHLSPVWKSVTEMFPPSTNAAVPSTTVPVPRPKSATPILPPPTNVPPSSLKSR